MTTDTHAAASLTALRADYVAELGNAPPTVPVGRTWTPRYTPGTAVKLDRGDHVWVDAVVLRHCTWELDNVAAQGVYVVRLADGHTWRAESWRLRVVGV